MTWRFRNSFSLQPSHSENAINKTLVIGSIILVSSAFVLIKNHSISALILGVVGIALLLAGATKRNTSTTDNRASTASKVCGNCGAQCESDWTYCVECAIPLTNQHGKICPHCKMKIETDWKFCAHCTKELK